MLTTGDDTDTTHSDDYKGNKNNKPEQKPKEPKNTGRTEETGKLKKELFAKSDDKLKEKIKTLCKNETNADIEIVRLYKEFDFKQFEKLIMMTDNFKLGD